MANNPFTVRAVSAFLFVNECSGLLHSPDRATEIEQWRSQVKAIDPRHDNVMNLVLSQGGKADDSVQAVNEPHRQPTAAEVSRLAFDKLRDARIRTQELSNQFARLLNRGSSLE